MTTPTSSHVTQLLAAVGHGDASAHDRLWSLVYDELRGLAKGQLAQEGQRGAVQPTSLVHEAYIRLTGDDEVEWANRRHFFAAAAQAMRRIRIDYARKRDSLKRGGDRQQISLDEDAWTLDHDLAEVLDIEKALKNLEREHPQRTEVVMLRYFGGLTIDETAMALGISPRMVDKQWSFARAWLHRELSEGNTRSVSQDA